MKSPRAVALGVACVAGVGLVAGAFVFMQAPNPGRAAIGSGDAQEAIKVHGSWTVSVRSSAGGLVERRAFENELGEAGKAKLVRYLARDDSPGQWQISAGAVRPKGASPCSSAGPCVVDETSGLTITTEKKAAALVLSGSFTAAFDGEISFVATDMSFCSASTAPAACVGTAGLTKSFTFRRLGSPIAVGHGQIVSFSVRLTFS